MPPRLASLEAPEVRHVRVQQSRRRCNKMAETKLFKTEERMERSAAARMLRELADRVESGRVVLRTAGNELVMEPPQQVVFEVQAEREDRSEERRVGKGGGPG